MYIWMHKRDRKFQKWVGRERECDWKKACKHETMLVSIPHLPLLVYYFLFSLSHPPLFSNCVKTLNFLLYGIRMKENWTKTNAKAMDRRGEMDGWMFRRTTQITWHVHAYQSFTFGLKKMEHWKATRTSLAHTHSHLESFYTWQHSACSIIRRERM